MQKNTLLPLKKLPCSSGCLCPTTLPHHCFIYGPIPPTCQHPDFLPQPAKSIMVYAILPSPRFKDKPFSATQQYGRCQSQDEFPGKYSGTIDSLHHVPSNSFEIFKSQSHCMEEEGGMNLEWAECINPEKTTVHPCVHLTTSVDKNAGLRVLRKDSEKVGMDASSRS